VGDHEDRGVEGRLVSYTSQSEGGLGPPEQASGLAAQATLNADSQLSTAAEHRPLTTYLTCRNSSVDTRHEWREIRKIGCSGAIRRRSSSGASAPTP
jgi:hypothetical protein